MRIIFKFSALVSTVLIVAGCVSYAPRETIVGDYLSARLAAEVNDIDAAARAFSAAAREAPGSRDLIRNAFFYQLAAGEIEAALPTARRLAALSDGGDEGLAHLTLAAHAIVQEDFRSARALMETAPVASYMKGAANIVHAWAIVPQKGPNAALDWLRQAAGEEFKGFYPLHQALLLEAAGKMDEARAAYQLAMMSFGGSVEVAAYGGFLERAGDVDAAREFYELLSEQPGLGRIAAQDGLMRLQSGARPPAFSAAPHEGAALAFYALANGILQQTVSQRTAAQNAGFRIGAANFNPSLALTQIALYLNPSFDDARRLAGSIFNVYGEYEKAIALLKEVRPSSPYYVQSRIEIASALNALEKYDEAIAALRGAAAQETGSYDARLSLAGFYAARERHEDAVETLDELTAALPTPPPTDAWRVYISRAASLMALDEWPRAEADLKRAYEIAPEEATVLNYLGYSWAERGENLDEAFALIEKAVAMDPGSGAIIDSLGWAHYQLGDYNKALGHLEQAASLEPADPTITDHLGDVYWRLGRQIEAKYQWRRVLELEPDAELKAAVSEKLERGLGAKAHGQDE